MKKYEVDFDFRVRPDMKMTLSIVVSAEADGEAFEKAYDKVKKHMVEYEFLEMRMRYRKGEQQVTVPVA